PPERSRDTATAAASAHVSVNVCVMKFMPMKRNQGETASSSTARRAVRRSYTACSSIDASSTLSAFSTGFTSHGAPSSTPTESAAGQPGGTGEYQRVASYVIRSMLNASGTGGAGIASMPAAK